MQSQLSSIGAGFEVAKAVSLSNQMKQDRYHGTVKVRSDFRPFVRFSCSGIVLKLWASGT